MYKRATSVLLAFILVLISLPTFAATPEETTEVTTAKAEAVWESLEKEELRLLDAKSNKTDYMQAAFNLVKSQTEAENLEWEDEDTFTFMLGDVPCAYDYTIRLAELKPDGESMNYTKVTDYGSKGVSVKGGNVFLAAPYYGADSSFDTSFYRNRASSIANAIGGTVTEVVGTNATPAAIRARFASAQDTLMIFDSHGISTYGSSYFCVRSSSGITSSDFSNYWAVSLGSGTYGIDGSFMTNGGTTPMSNAFCWFAICEGMMTDGMCAPLMSAGAGAIYGYSQSVSFTKDYAFARAFYTKLVDGSTVADSIAYMKSQCGNYDNYVSPYAYPIVVSDLDAYPSNPDSVQTVYCTWTIFGAMNLYEVKFVDWDGRVISTQRVKEGEAATAPQNPIREGYTFTGWDTDFSNVTEDLTVTATYSINMYKLTYYVDGALYHQEDIEYNTAIVPIAVPEKEGHTFSGWDLVPTVMPARNVDVNGTFTVNTYTVRFLDWDGTELSTQTVEYGNAAQAPENPVRDGYVFVTWDKDFSCVKSDMTVIAVYVMATHTVRFVDWDGTELSVQTVKHGEAATAPTDPSREGHTFTGWDADFSNVTSDITITAQYKANLYGVRFVDWDDTVLSVQMVEYGQSATPPTLPERVGYVFTGWDTDYTIITADVTIKAQYKLESIMGDVTGDGIVNTADAVFVLRYTAGMETLTEEQSMLADVDQNSAVNTADVTKILRYCAGMSDLPTEPKQQID